MHGYTRNNGFASGMKQWFEAIVCCVVTTFVAFLVRWKLCLDYTIVSFIPWSFQKISEVFGWVTMYNCRHARRHIQATSFKSLTKELQLVSKLKSIILNLSANPWCLKNCLIGEQQRNRSFFFGTESGAELALQFFHVFYNIANYN